MEVSALKESLKKIQAANQSTEWNQNLNERKQKELDFHNRDRDKKFTQELPKDTFELLHGNKKYYSTVETSTKYVSQWIKDNAKGKVFLDYACGNGANAIEAAKAGANLSIGLDISDVSVLNGQKLADELGLTGNCAFVQGDCENTGLPSDSVDTIICSGMLHHLDLSFAFPELRRILKPGGKILAVEALDYNPVIKLYRIMTPTMRTEWEKNHILSLKDLKFASKFFTVKNVNYWHLFSIAAVMLKDKKSLFKKLLKVLNKVDGLAMKLPGLQLMAWQFSFELHKPQDSKDSPSKS